MPLVRDIKNRDAKKTLIITLGNDAKRLHGEQKKKKKKKKASAQEYMFFVQKKSKPVFSPVKIYAYAYSGSFYCICF